MKSETVLISSLLEVKTVQIIDDVKNHVCLVSPALSNKNPKVYA